MASAENEIKAMKIAQIVSDLLQKRFEASGLQISTAVDLESIIERASRLNFKMTVSQEHGIFDLIIDKSALSVVVEDSAKTTGEKWTWVKVDLDYEHPGGGRNGFEIVRLWLDEKLKLTESVFTKPAAEVVG